jgi:nitrogen fixation protein NifQ
LENSGGEDGQGFDLRVLVRMVRHAAAEAERLGQPVPDRLGVDGGGFAALAAYLCIDSLTGGTPHRQTDPDDEEIMVRELLRQNCAANGPLAEWISCIVARRALEPNHLWEDLGLAARGDLSTLLDRHFPALAAKNTRNMRWKKFLYRALCEAEGFSMCPSPTCDSCAEFDLCYGDESGASQIVRNNRKSQKAD